MAAPNDDEEVQKGSISQLAKELGRLIAFLVGLFFVFVALDILISRDLSPAGRATTLSDFLRWQSDAQRFYVISEDGESFVLAFGPRQSRLMTSSGASIYVYDEAGNLVDWSVDSGDDPDFYGQWFRHARLGGTRQTRGEVEQMLEITIHDESQGEP